MAPFLQCILIKILIIDLKFPQKAFQFIIPSLDFIDLHTDLLNLNSLLPQVLSNAFIITTDFKLIQETLQFLTLSLILSIHLLYLLVKVLHISLPRFMLALLTFFIKNP